MDFDSFVSKQTDRFFKELLKESLGKKKLRKYFSESVKNKVLAMQYNRCKYCGMGFGMVNFDHINGDSSNNSISNCQALCPNCHAMKTSFFRGN